MAVGQNDRAPKCLIPDNGSIALIVFQSVPDALMPCLLQKFLTVAVRLNVDACLIDQYRLQFWREIGFDKCGAQKISRRLDAHKSVESIVETGASDDLKQLGYRPDVLCCGQNGFLTRLCFKMPEAISGQMEERVGHARSLLRSSYLRPVERKELYEFSGGLNAVMSQGSFRDKIHYGQQ